jgi:hypothetical protein
MVRSEHLRISAQRPDQARGGHSDSSELAGGRLVSGY